MSHMQFVKEFCLPKMNFPPFAFMESRWTGEALRAEMTPK
jgi:hypothetical protein